jgi:hypothetical protein
MSNQQFAEVLFAGDVQPDDVDILIKATAEKPGLLRLNRAYLGPTRPDAPNSAPLLSWTGAQIGYVAAESLLEPPFMDTYWLAAEEEDQNEPQPTSTSPF